MSRQVKALVRKLEATKAKLAKDRDALRDLQGEIEGLLDSTNEGLEDLDRAIDSISRYA